MAPDQAIYYRLDDEQCARLRDCLTKEGLSLSPDRVERLTCDIEVSIARFLAAPSDGTFRSAHDALRQLWELSHGEDPPVAVIRARIQALPRQAVEYVDRRAPTVIARLFSARQPVTNFREWAGSADRKMLIAATRIVSGEGGRAVVGRSRGTGRRSARRLQPMIMGATRGGGTGRNRGGRPRTEYHRDLVMHLAMDWLTATGDPPKPGRSDSAGFGDLVHSAFQWCGLPEGSAAYALRQYWTAVKALKAQEPLENFLRRHAAER